MLALVLALVADPLAHESFTTSDATRLNGKTVTITFKSGKPPITWRGNTTAGPADQPDGFERTVILKGERLDVRDGETLTVTGTMRLIHHPAVRIGAVLVPQWPEIRVEETGIRPWRLGK